MVCSYCWLLVYCMPRAVCVLVGVSLSVCEAWSRGSRSRSRGSRSLVTCCSRQMEARLITHARHELSRLLTSKLNDVRHDFSNANNDFESMQFLAVCRYHCFILSGALQQTHEILTVQFIKYGSI